MTLEELQAALEAEKQRSEALLKEKEQLEQNVKNQNSYITKLEQNVKKPEQQIGGPTITDKRLSEYLARNMKRDAIDEAFAVINQNVAPEIVECLKPEVLAMIDKTMTIDRTQPSYVIDAFNIIYGSAMTNKNHKIHQIGKAPEPKPATAPAQPGPAQQVAQPVAAQPAINEQLKAFMGTTPTMTPSDKSAVQAPPNTSPTPIANTRDAMSRFKDAIKNAGANRFS